MHRNPYKLLKVKSTVSLNHSIVYKDSHPIGYNNQNKNCHLSIFYSEYL